MNCKKLFVASTVHGGYKSNEENNNNNILICYDIFNCGKLYNNNFCTIHFHLNCDMVV